MSEFPRELKPEERDILDFVIAANADYRHELDVLLRDAKATHACPCGCGSITLTTNGAARRTWPVSPLTGIAVAEYEETRCIVMLFAERDGAGLEFVFCGDRPSRLPRKNELRVQWEEWVVDGSRRGELGWINSITMERRPWNDGVKPQE